MSGTTFLVVVGIGALALYIASVYRYPRKRCKRCYVATGRDFAPRPLGRLVYRRCRKCNGTGWHTRRMRVLLGGRLEDDDTEYDGP